RAEAGRGVVSAFVGVVALDAGRPHRRRAGARARDERGARRSERARRRSAAAALTRPMRFALAALLASCAYLPRCSTATGQSPSCVLESGSSFGPDGAVAVRAETVVSGLEVPWSFAFLPGGDVLVSERPGRVRLLRGGQ